MKSISRNEEIKLFSIRSKVMLPYIESIELTQNSLVMPFLNILGLDAREIKTRRVISDNEKFIVAYERDFISNHEVPLFVLECLHHTEPIQRLSVDITKFNRTIKAKYAVLTNGLDYKFHLIKGHASKKKPIPLFAFRITKTRTRNILKLLNQHLDLSFTSISN